MNGIERIAAERTRQQLIEGFNDNHDDDHQLDEIAWMAVAYAAPTCVQVRTDGADVWPEGVDLDKRPREAETNEVLDNDILPINERIRQLEKAGALIAAEIDRLLRARK